MRTKSHQTWINQKMQFGVKGNKLSTDTRTKWKRIRTERVRRHFLFFLMLLGTIHTGRPIVLNYPPPSSFMFRCTYSMSHFARPPPYALSMGRHWWMVPYCWQYFIDPLSDIFIAVNHTTNQLRVNLIRNSPFVKHYYSLSDPKNCHYMYAYSIRKSFITMLTYKTVPVDTWREIYFQFCSTMFCELKFPKETPNETSSVGRFNLINSWDQFCTRWTHLCALETNWLAFL